MLLVWVLAFIALGFSAILYQTTHTPVTQTQSPSRSTVRVGSAEVMAEVADTLALQVRGLSGRSSLAEGQGMLFVFESEGTHGIWMKDMRFAIDIIWATSDGTIITITEHVSPDTYPQSFYASEPTARYVLEVGAGFVVRHGIAVGDKVVVQ